MADEFRQSPPPYDPRRNTFRSRSELKDWQASDFEEVLEPSLPIIDPHHHLFRRVPNGYLVPDLLADLETGHNIVATVFMEGDTGYRRYGPEAFRPIGETEFVLASIAASEAAQRRNVARGLVGFADLRLGERVIPVLEGHLAAGQGRMRGIRQALRWDPFGIGLFGGDDPPHLATDTAFRAGLSCLAPLGLSFDVWIFHHQLEELVELVSAFPGTAFIVNHIGGPLGAGAYADKKREVLEQWRRGMAKLAEYPNVSIKLGGCGMLYFGFDFYKRARPPSSDTLARAWRPYFLHCIDLYGVDRCMFESNFPVDQQTCSYRTLWNAFKIVTRDFSEAEKSALYCSTASAAYRLMPQTRTHPPI